MYICVYIILWPRRWSCRSVVGISKTTHRRVGRVCAASSGPGSTRAINISSARGYDCADTAAAAAVRYGTATCTVPIVVVVTFLSAGVRHVVGIIVCFFLFLSTPARPWHDDCKNKPDPTPPSPKHTHTPTPLVRCRAVVCFPSPWCFQKF